MILKSSIETLMRGTNLNAETIECVMNEILLENVNPLQAAAFLVLLRSKTETSDELTSLVNILKKKMLPVQTHHAVLDIVGTGGDGANTVNISTGSAILAASCGIKIAKHGNRAVSSSAGSADVLEALGINIHLSAERIANSIDEIGIGFCFSPNFHPAMQQLRRLRKQLNVPTTFNLLGPLLNPANPKYLLLGVYDESLLRLTAETLSQMNIEHAFVVHGEGLDEVSCLGPSNIIEIKHAEITHKIIDPQTFGFKRCSLEDLRGGNAQTNAKILRDVFSGKTSSAIADTLTLNAAIAMYLYGLHDSIAIAISHAKEHLQSGITNTFLKNWIEHSHDYAT